ncbi:MAG: hypothetical protein WCL23_03320 [Candidatus Moraniibacteriota bacterium]
MTQIISLFYLILFLCISATGLFISYHVLRYSQSKKSAVATMVLFSSVFVLLLITNAALFFRVDWNSLLNNSSSLGKTSYNSPY